MAIKSLEEQLTRDEGVVKHAYQDHMGYWTIGIGRLIDKRKGGGLSPEEISYLFNNDVKKKKDELFKRLPWIKNLDVIRQEVLINMSFQLGVDGVLKFVRTLKMIEGGAYERAAEGMMESLWAKQTPERAQRLANQIKYGTRQ